MTTLDISNLDDSGYDIPDQPHVQIMFDALDDTVAGNEGFNLTTAQRYAFGVMRGSGNLSAREGNEGFFSSIGSGIKATFNYIVDMFKKLWGFFFKRDAKTTCEKASKEIKEDIAKLDKLASGPSNDAEADEMIADAKKLVHRLGHEGSDAAKIKESQDKWQDELMAASKGSLSDKKKALSTIVHDVPKLNVAGQRVLKNRAQRVAQALEAFITFVKGALEDEAKAGPQTKKALAIGKGLFSEIETMVKIMEGVEDLSDISKAKTHCKAAASLVDALKAMAAGMSGGESSIKSVIDGLEKKVEGEMSAEDKAHLADMRGLMVLAASMGKFIKTASDGMEKFSKSVTEIFG